MTPDTLPLQYSIYKGLGRSSVEGTQATGSISNLDDSKELGLIETELQVTMLSSVCATNDRWNTAGRSRQWKRVCKALRGSANGGSCRAGDAAADLEEAGGRDGRGAGDHEAVEVQSQLKIQTKAYLRGPLQLNLL